MKIALQQENRVLGIGQSYVIIRVQYISLITISTNRTTSGTADFRLFFVFTSDLQMRF